MENYWWSHKENYWWSHKENYWWSPKEVKIKLLGPGKSGLGLDRHIATHTHRVGAVLNLQCVCEGSNTPAKKQIKEQELMVQGKAPHLTK